MPFNAEFVEAAGFISCSEPTTRLVEADSRRGCANARARRASTSVASVRYVAKSRCETAVLGIDTRPACSAQNTMALDRAHAADRNWPFDMARHAVVSSRSAARAKAVVWGRTLYGAIRSPVVSEGCAGVRDRESEVACDAASHRISAREISIRLVGLARRWWVARDRSVACNRCTGKCGRRIDWSADTRENKEESVAISPTL
eukprot:5355216-Pleurochrysis_carterae.AAC.3